MRTFIYPSAGELIIFFCVWLEYTWGLHAEKGRENPGIISSFLNWREQNGSLLLDAVVSSTARTRFFFN